LIFGCKGSDYFAKKRKKRQLIVTHQPKVDLSLPLAASIKVWQHRKFFFAKVFDNRRNTCNFAAT
jgi:hypothetical protein